MATDITKEQINESAEVTIERVTLNGEKYYKINNNDFMRPFFMSIVSDSNHWMFIASNGGITAGRKNPDYSIFPYYTDDKVTESFETTGSKTIFNVVKNGKRHVWEPFSIRSDGFYETTRNLYKGVRGSLIRTVTGIWFTGTHSNTEVKKISVLCCTVLMYGKRKKLSTFSYYLF